MKVKLFENEPTLGVIAFSGELDGVSTPQLSEELHRLMEQNRVHVILDLTRNPGFASIPWIPALTWWTQCINFHFLSLYPLIG